MNTKEIERLTEKYFNGETTLTEEEMLQKFFAGTAIPPHLLGLKPLFEVHQNEKHIQIQNPLFERNILEMIEKDKKTERKFKRRTLITVWTTIAAAVIISITFVFETRTSEQEKKNIEAEQAYIEINKALIYVASQFNKGLQPVQKTGNKLSKGFDPVKKISQLDQTLNKVKQIN
jgi:hypothetical protein